MLEGGDNKAKIIVESCVIFPFNSTSNTRYSLINERIAVDEGTLILRSPKLNFVRFKTHMVMIGINDHEMYLNCNTYLCPSSDKSATCTDRRAMAQHTSYATRLQEESKEDSLETDTSNKLIAITGISEHINVNLPKFLPEQLSNDEVPNIGKDDYIRIGLVDNLLYHFNLKNNTYVVELYKGTGKMKSGFKRDLLK